jgi:hypothetical protein
MEAVRDIESVRLPVLTPNLKVNYVDSYGHLLKFVCSIHSAQLFQHFCSTVHHSSGV